MPVPKHIRVTAPGRICLFGEHQDFLGLPVIACAIELGICLTLALQLAIKQGSAAGGCDRGPDGRSGLESCGGSWRVIAVSPGTR